MNTIIEKLISDAERECAGVFAAIDANETYHTERVIRSFHKHRVASRHFAPTTGYGYDDIGRDTLSEIFADLLGVEKALVRPQIASGTHALAGEGDGCLGEGHITDIDIILDIVSCCIAGNDVRRIEGVDAGLDDDIG